MTVRAAVVAMAIAACATGTEPLPHATVAAVQPPQDPLPAWTDGAAKQALVAFVARVTRPGVDYVPAEARVAVFDNDGTLWAEQPNYAQAAFACARPGKPGETADDFTAEVQRWIAVARNPETGRLYTDMVYAPMLELLAYLRANGFRVYIVTGGGADFVRAWSERVYGVPREHVIGSRSRMTYERRNGRGVVVRERAIEFAADGPNKAVAIEQGIGRRPILAFGNSDNDFEMLEYTTTAPGPRLGLLLHHTDGAREWAYDRDSPIGRLARGLDAAPAHGWVVVDMRRDWRVVFPAARAARREATPPRAWQCRS